MLIGMDLISTHQLNINAKKRVVSSDWGESEFLAGEPTPVVRRIKVRAEKSTVIPAKSVSFVMGDLNGENRADKNKVLSGHFEPYSAGNGLISAEALCHCENNRVPVRIMNLTDEPVVLFKRKLLGFLDPPMQAAQSLKTVKIVQRIAAKVEEQEVPGQHDAWTRERLFHELKLDNLEVSKDEKRTLKEIIWKHRGVFSKHEFDLGSCHFFKARINLKKDAEPQYVAPIPTPYKQWDALQRHLDGLIKAGVIEETEDAKYSMWNARVFLVAKSHQPNRFRFVADFRALNSQCLPDNYTLPNINIKLSVCKNG
jgi:hypothetical protein